MAWDEYGIAKEIKSLKKRYPAPRQSRARGEDGGVYTAEMGAPPQDIDMGSSQKTVKKAKGGKIDGCAQRGKTRGRNV